MSELAFTKDKNQVATPWHIVDFLSDLLGTAEKKVLDPTAGAGAMLRHAKEPLGIEFDQKAFGLLKENVPTGELINASVFDSAEWIREKAPDVVLMNPPFNCSRAIMPKEYTEKYGAKGVDQTKGLYFVRWVADTVSKGAMAAIVPNGAIEGGNKACDTEKRELLARHKLVAVIKLNGELFYPAAGVQTVILVIKPGQPNDGKTWFADFSEDGLTKDRTKGRIDTEGKWAETKARWLDLTRRRPSDPENGYDEESADPEKSWLPDRVIKKKPEPPTYEDFYAVVKDYMTWKLNTYGWKRFMEEFPDLKPSPERRLAELQRRMYSMLQQIEQIKQEIEAKGAST